MLDPAVTTKKKKKTFMDGFFIDGFKTKFADGFFETIYKKFIMYGLIKTIYKIYRRFFFLNRL